MAEHSELVNEMAILEKLGTQERLKIAKKRRLQQLKKWTQREKEFNNTNKKNKKLDLNGFNSQEDKKKRKNDRVHFVESVMLLEAAARNDIEEVRRLLMDGVNPDSTNEDGLTALHQCCIDDSEEMMKLLVNFGANVNAKDSEAWTPLHAAATCGHLHLVKYLIEKGANLLAVNADNNMPYDICEHEETLDYIEQQMASCGITQQQIDETRAQTEMDMLQFLKEQVANGVDLTTIKFDCNSSSLHVASANGYLQVVEFLLEHNFPVNIEDDDQWTSVHAAVLWAQQDVLEILARAGADLNATTKNGETVFDICEDLELKEHIEQLKNEMETKQQQLLQNLNGSSRLKRSHSQNTRSHSVRRTSIREKRDTSRREAREEAKIRHLNDDATLTTDSNNQQSASTQKSALTTNLTNVTSLKNNLSNQSNFNNHNQSHQQSNHLNSLNIPLNSSSYAAQQEKENNHLQKEMNLYFNNSNNKDKNEQNHQKSLNDNQDSSLKLEINISHQSNDHKSSNQLNNCINNYSTNCSNINTLDGLKKFRTDLRNRNHTDTDLQKEAIINNDIYKNLKNNLNNKFNSSNGETMVDGLINRFDNSNHNNRFDNQNNHNNNYLTPSPNSTLRHKFRGDPSDMIGEMQKRNKCCVIM